ncbi:hypothetical protein BGZ96_005041, partial [Linnemannia gamsii]
AILGLLSSRKLWGLALSNINYFGLRTSQLSSSQAPSCLRSFQFLQRITAVNEPRLIEVLTHSPGIVDLRLGSFNYFSEGCPNLSRSIDAVNFRQLQELSIFQMTFDWSAEAVLAARSDEFSEELLVKYAYLEHIGKQEIHLEESQSLQGTEYRLARGRIQAIGMMRQSEEYSHSIFGGGS